MPLAAEKPPVNAGPVQRIRRFEDLANIEFHDGMAAVEVPWKIVREIDFKNDRREESPRLDVVARSIRSHGYQPFDPILIRIGQKGRWIVVDGGHRLTAARMVAGEFWTNLWGRKVQTLYFLLFTTPRSWAKIKTIADRHHSRNPVPEHIGRSLIPETVPEAAGIGTEADQPLPEDQVAEK